MRTFILTDKTNSSQEILGELHKSGLNFRKVKRLENNNEFTCYFVETESKKEQKNVLLLAKNTGNLASLLAVKDNLTVQKGDKLVAKFTKIENKTDNCFVYNDSFFQLEELC